MMHNCKIVIPGGAGLVGQNLIVQLKQEQYLNIVVLDKHKRNTEILKQLHPDICVECVDLADEGEWQNHFKDADVVVMLQAQIGSVDPEPFLRNNITSTHHILALIKKYDIPYTVHISSSVVKSVANDHYTATKKTQEQLVVASGIRCVVLRPTLMFGWFDRKHLGWLARFMSKVPVFPIPGDGRYMRQPLYVWDFCSIIVSCIKNEVSGKTYNITGLERVDYIDIIKEIKKVINSRTILVKIPVNVFSTLLKVWAMFDKNPPFTVDQLKALVAHDEFEEINWPTIFGVERTDFPTAVFKTFTDPKYSKITLDF